MKLTVDSPELTAFALGELEPGQAREVARRVAADPVLEQEVEAIRRVAAELASGLATEPVAALEPERRTHLVEEAGGAADLLPVVPPASPGRARPIDPPPVPWWTRFWPVAVGLAAVALVAVLWIRGGPGVGRMARLEEGTPFDRLRYQPDRPASAPVTNGASPRGESRARRDLAKQSADSPGPAPASPPPPAAIPVGRPTRSAGGPAPVPPGESKRYAAPARERVSAASAAAAAPPSPASAPEPTLARRYGLVRSPAPGDAPALAVEASDPLGRGFGGGAVHGGLPGIPPAGGEGYAAIQENPFRPVTEAPLSTFGLDVDTASYANVRRFLREGVLPPADAVRLEEMINYFSYRDPAPDGDHPVAVSTEMAECPWTPGHRLLRVAIRSREIRRAARPDANLVFLVDVSGSMEPESKLPLVKRTLRLLVEKLTARDSVAIVTYAGEAGVALAPTRGGDKGAILRAIEALKAGGSTHGSAGITTAYDLAARHWVKDGINRVLLCTDGDFNVGLTSRDALLELIAGKAKTGVFLSVLGYGMGNYQDQTTELLADRGNGNYAYIDSYREAQKVLLEQLESTLVTVARDVKLQLEFNPARVARHRLLGYENRLLADRDFNDDTKDAGEVGAGLSVTALYEIVPTGGGGEGVDPLRYGRAAEPAPKPVHADEWLLVKLRYQRPEGSPSQLLTRVVKDGGGTFEAASADLRFAGAAAGFGMILRNSAHQGGLNWEQVARMAEGALGDDPGGYRAEMVDLVRRAQQLAGRR